MRYVFLLIAFSLVIVGCSQHSQQISDCSNVTIPSDKEVNTNIDKEEKFLEATWRDDTKGRDVTVTIRYTDDNCSWNSTRLIKDNKERWVLI
jgi:uncharacterized protein YcfL